MRQQQWMNTMAHMTSTFKANGRMDAKNGRWVSELLAADWKKRGTTQIGRTQCSDGVTGKKK